MRARHVLSLLAALIGPGLSPAPAVLASDFPEHSIDVGGTKRWFRALAPAKLAPGAPAVIVLHGGTQSMRKIFETSAGSTREWPILAREKGFLLLAPNGTETATGRADTDNQSWNDLRSLTFSGISSADDVAFIERVIDWAASTHRIDPTRVYVTGASNGGMMSMRLLIERPARFAAGAAFIGSLPAERAALPKPSLATPILVMNGTEDPLVPWQGGMVARNRGEVRSTPSTIAWWIAANGADPAERPPELLPDLDPSDGCRIERRTYPAKTGAGAPVVFYTMRGGGHVPPSRAHPLPVRPLLRLILGPECRDAEAARIAWEFFAMHRRKGP